MAVDIYDRLGDGYHIGNALPGEWYEYTVGVQQAGDYVVKAYLATPDEGGRSVLQIGDSDPDTIIAISSNSWLDTQPVTSSMYLEVGQQVMRYSILSGPQFNIDKFEFKLAEDTVSEGINDQLIGKLLVVTTRGNGLLVKMNNRQVIDVLKIYSSYGMLVESVNNPGTSFLISDGTIQKGVYIVRVLSGNKLYTRKISFH